MPFIGLIILAGGFSGGPWAYYSPLETTTKAPQTLLSST